MVTPTVPSDPDSASDGSRRAHESTVASARIGLQMEGLALVLVNVTRHFFTPSCQVTAAGAEQRGVGWYGIRQGAECGSGKSGGGRHSIASVVEGITT